MVQQSRTLLLVDDDPADIAMLVARIQNTKSQHNYECLIARNGTEAIMLYARHRVDCALVDYNMPGETGLELAETLHKLPYHGDVNQNLPVLIMSGTAANDDVISYIKTHEALEFALKKEIADIDRVAGMIEQVLHLVNSA